jgi:flagellar biosynthetic protein FlhB
MRALYGGRGAEALLEELPLIDLQWFAAEDEGRTEDPTERKIQKAREEGRVAKSQELIGALVLLLPALVIFFLAPSMLNTCLEMLRFYFLRASELDPVKDRILAGAFFRYLARLALPIVSSAMAAAIFANLAQTGFLFTTKPLTPDFSKVVPRLGRYFQKTLFSLEGLFNFGKSLFKMVVIGAVAFFLIRGELERLANLQTATLLTGLTTTATLAIRMLLICAVLLLLLSIPDMLFQRWQYRESLTMSKEEVKEERKMDQGDPLIKSRLRQRMRELLSRNIAVTVPKAHVVITNPTHFAVALEYQKGMEGPMVIAKGEDELALRIRRIAEEHEVPIVENRRLARELYAEVKVGDTIPEAYYKVVLEILVRVYNMNERLRRDAGFGA